jgi:hypothetical protein
MPQTNIPYGSPQAITLQSIGIFAANMQRNSTLNRLTGKFPQQADAEAAIRQQSSNKMPIVRCMDLAKMAGDEVTFDLIQPMGGKPIMGSRMAEGRGKAMNFDQDRLRINQARYPISRRRHDDRAAHAARPALARPHAGPGLHGPPAGPAHAGAPGRRPWLPRQHRVGRAAGQRRRLRRNHGQPGAGADEEPALHVDGLGHRARQRDGQRDQPRHDRRDERRRGRRAAHGARLDAAASRRRWCSTATRWPATRRCACCWSPASSTRRSCSRRASAPCRPTRWRAPRRPARTRSSWARRACGTAS